MTGVSVITGFAMFVSLAVSGLMPLARIGDTANHRSAHRGTIPTGGGAGIVAGVFAAILLMTIFYPWIDRSGDIVRIAALGLGAGLLGFGDDIIDLRAPVKFTLLFVLAAAGAAVIGVPSALPLSEGQELALPYSFGFLGAMLWIFVVVNAVNFMDGINGMMAGCMAVAFLGLALVCLGAGVVATGVVSLLMVAALLGFIPYNFRQDAVIFSGDVGALFVGMVFALCALSLPAGTGRIQLLYVGPILILPFLTDILLTMAMRAKLGEALIDAHNYHIYQRLAVKVSSHMKVSFFYMFLFILCFGAAMVGGAAGWIGTAGYLALVVAIFAFLYVSAHRWLTGKN